MPTQETIAPPGTGLADRPATLPLRLISQAGTDAASTGLVPSTLEVCTVPSTKSSHAPVAGL